MGVGSEGDFCAGGCSWWGLALRNEEGLQS